MYITSARGHELSGRVRTHAYNYNYVVMCGRIKSTATHYITARYSLRVLYQRVHDDINYLCHVRSRYVSGINHSAVTDVT